MTAAQVNGITIEYDEHGDPGGEPLLLVMGLGAQLIDWPIGFVELLVERGFRVIRFDNRDIGLSTKIDAPAPTVRQMVLSTLSRRFAHPAYLLSDMAADAAALLDHLGIAKAHIVGASMGGMIVQTMAIEHPDKVLSLTSIMSNTGDRKHGKIALQADAQDAAAAGQQPQGSGRGWRRGRPAGRRPALRRGRGPQADRRGPGPRRRTARASAARRWPSPAARTAPRRWRRSTVPTLVIHGLVDPLVKPSGGITTAKAIPGAKLLMFPDMGHDLPDNRWHEVVDAIAANAHEQPVPTNA